MPILERLRKRARPEECTVDLDLTKESPRGWISWLGCQVGHIDLSIERDVAQLVEIYIQPRLLHWHPVLRGFGFMTSFQERGLGTILLTETLVRLRQAGVRAVWGKMGGDEKRLLRWYRSMGFSVDPATGRMWKDLSGAEP